MEFNGYLKTGMLEMNKKGRKYLFPFSENL